MSLFRNETVYTPNIIGVTNGVAAAAGSVGEVIQAQVAVGSAVALTTATPANVITITLTPGDWDVEGSVNLAATGATTAAGSLWVAGINTTSATIPTTGAEVQNLMPALTTTTFKDAISLPNQQINVNTTTKVYLVAEVTFTAGTVAGYGSLIARRIH